MDRPTPPQNCSGTVCQILFNWYTPTSKSKTTFTYDTTDFQWIDVEMVISSVTLTMKSGIGRVYVLDPVDKKALQDYVETMTGI
ncbi:unnamed protein product [Calypogeia fissa]